MTAKAKGPTRSKCTEEEEKRNTSGNV